MTVTVREEPQPYYYFVSVPCACGGSKRLDTKGCPHVGNMREPGDP